MALNKEYFKISMERPASEGKMKNWMKTPGKLIMVLLVTAIIVLALSACTGPAGAQGATGQQGQPG